MARKNSNLSKSIKSRQMWAYIFILPQAIVFLLLSLYPIVMSYVYSFYSWDGASPLTDFVGFENYTELFYSSRFWGALVSTIIYMFGTTILGVGASLVLAIILNANNMKGKAFYRTIYFIPVVATTAIIGVVMKNIFGVDGSVNQLIQSVGLTEKPIPWLNTSTLAMTLLIVVGTWKNLGINMIYWLSGLQSIPAELYESAQLDGAGFWKTLYHITLPLLKPILLVILLLSVVSGMNAFDLVKTLTNGNPYHTTETLDLYVFNYAFGGGMTGSTTRMGYASAAGVMLGMFTLLISGIFGLITMYYQKREKKEASR
ncbi:raffinose/stachyose/melibiose transport system permease protein [Gracilibacillus orientalis]|uniref:Raffinose/stachyose/melibiose transport system permease protein n=1 Tax=Gracilibacillus orientalis TaxID=334253 RepID=A0A1I4IC80_9BACI|nr:sugar ABC transporter permease [Gracilibacillus orientalis]SFL51905.1 raffinose/stachyose/melibiose transport system permease protein [Gracilibacillus orientalis]